MNTPKNAVDKKMVIPIGEGFPPEPDANQAGTIQSNAMFISEEMSIDVWGKIMAIIATSPANSDLTSREQVSKFADANVNFDVQSKLA